MKRILLDIYAKENVYLSEILDILFNSGKIETIDHIEKYKFKHRLYTTYRRNK